MTARESAPALGSAIRTKLAHVSHIAGVCETWIDVIARRRKLACVVVGVTVLAFRAAVLPIRPVPQPRYEDEFSYLLQGETFAKGRLTNPSHPLWRFFETIHVNQQPTYSGKYPPGQAAFLALGIKLFGHPWFGVWLSVALMCACLCWTIQGWLPPRYAFLGALAAALQFGGVGYWMNSYWGGAVAALGGALLLGALPRFKRRPSAPMATVAAIGVVILLNTRPFEGLILLAGCLCVLLWKAEPARLRRMVRMSVLGPACIVVTAGAVWMCLYNWRVTGDPWELPYQVHERQYAQAPVLWILPNSMPVSHRYRDSAMRRLWEWDAGLYTQARRNPLLVVVTFIRAGAATFVEGPMVWLIGFACVGLSFGPTSTRLRPAVAVSALFVGLVLTEKFILAHYLAPGVALVFLFTAAGLRWFWLSRDSARLGRLIAVAALVASVANFIVRNVSPPVSQAGHPLAARFSTEGQLERMPGQHVVFVQYSEQHDPHTEFVYNGPDIDAQKVIWANDLGRSENEQLRRYYPNRTFWLFRPDEPTPKVILYPWD
jgi:hypothetical protein